MIARARTLAQIRLLTALGPLERPRRRRLPQQQHPDLIIGEYFRELMAVAVAPAIAAARDIRHELVHALREARRERGHHDADDEARARHALQLAAKRAVGALRPNELHAVAAKFGTAASAFQRQQLDRQVRAAMGVPFSAIERPIRDRIPDFARANVALIRTVPTRMFERLQNDVEAAFSTAEHPDTFAERLVEREGMAEGDAMRIARDQIGTLVGQVNQERQQAIGCESFTWRGMMDNRERDSHVDLEGETFPWDDPPTDSETGEVITPGSAIQCRCYAEPVFPVASDEG